jgi:GTP-binding protein
MAFLDHVILNIKAGKGGDGVVRWRREAGIDMGGPAGGDGGKGGDVYVVGQRNLHTLHHFAHEKDFHAEDGLAGASKQQHGKSGQDLFLYFPLGSEIYVKEYDRTIDLTEEGQQVLLFHGGQGGLGNVHFKSSTNRSPEQATEGKIGEYGTVEVNLKFIADVGLVGYPNVGKSNLLNTLTKAQSKVGNYNFTTLEPHLGDYHGYIIADIPGLIEGAHTGKGLGIKFLKHVERTGLLVHMIDATSKDFAKDYKIIRTELGKFNESLHKKKEILVVTKIDNVYPKIKELSGKIKFEKITKPKLKVNKKLSKDEIKFRKELFKEETEKYKQTVKAQDEAKKKVKLFKDNIKKLEKFAKKKVFLLSLYDDKSVKDFEKVLTKTLK